jgi:hypothetical protein
MARKKKEAQDIEYHNTGSMWVYRVDGGDEVGYFQTKDDAVYAASLVTALPNVATVEEVDVPENLVVDLAPKAPPVKMVADPEAKPSKPVQVPLKPDYTPPAGSDYITTADPFYVPPAGSDYTPQVADPFNATPAEPFVSPLEPAYKPTPEQLDAVPAEPEVLPASFPFYTPPEEPPSPVDPAYKPTPEQLDAVEP